jgi:long-chain fatty acid transport protein
MTMKRLTGAAVALASSLAMAAGFELDGQDARSVGMGNAVTALTDDASAVYYNPAGLAGRKGLDVSLGGTLLFPSVSFKSDNTGATTTTKSSVATPINAYVSYGVLDDLTVAIGLTTPFGASALWPAGWEGAGKALTSSVQVFNINPSIAYRLHPRFKLGAGLQITRGTVYIERGLDFIDSQGTVKLGGDAWGLGWNAGFQMDLYENKVLLGGTWRSSVPLAFSGRAHFDGVPAAFQANLADQAITSNITLPDVATFGIAWKILPELRVAFDVHWTQWSTFQKLEIDFANSALTNPLAKRWRDPASLHLGAEYDINEAFSARAGFTYDPTPSPSETLTADLPDASRVRVTVGGTWRSTFGLRVSASYQYVGLLPQTSTAAGFSGTYSGSAHEVALSVGYRF